jgi:N-terminal half of MaoC dehydratase
MTTSRFPIEAGHILTFARAIGDENPAYQGALDGTPDTPAPPTFVQAAAQFDPDYVLRPHEGEQWFGSGADDGFAAPGRGGLHAEQHFAYHRPLRAGMVLTATTRDGESWQKEGRRGGILSFSETLTDYRDSDGQLVVTARAVGVKTERVVEAPST